MEAPVFVHKWAEVMATRHTGPTYTVKEKGFLGKPLKIKKGQWIVRNRLGEVTVMDDKDFRFWFRSNNPAAAAAFGETSVPGTGML